MGSAVHCSTSLVDLAGNDWNQLCLVQIFVDTSGAQYNIQGEKTHKIKGNYYHKTHWSVVVKKKKMYKDHTKTRNTRKF